MSIWNYFFKAKGAESNTTVEAEALREVRRDARRINQNDLSFRLAEKILSVQRFVASYLNTKTRDISKRKIRLSLVCCIALGCMYCLYLILSAVLIFLQ